MEIVLLIANLTLIGIMGLILYELHSLPVFLLDNEASQQSSSDEGNTYFQGIVDERDEEFENRMARLKDELANKQEVKPREESEAEILHPGITNLPHDDERARNDLEPTEIAE